MSSSIIVTNEKSKDDTQQKLRIKKNFYVNSLNKIIYFLDPIAQQRVLHRRIHSDPLLSIPKDSIDLNCSRVVSPPPIPFYDDIKTKQQDTIPSISYLQTEEYGSYSSSYDSRGDTFDQNKQTKLTLGQSTNIENNNRESISSQMTLTDEQDNSLYSNHLSPITNNDDAILSITSTSPTEQSGTMSTTDYPIRSNFQFA
jgi:hypothetical protein